jgi:gliding motility-associated-like protein
VRIPFLFLFALNGLLSFAQGPPPYCILPTSLKSIVLSYTRYPPLQLPNFRFYYRVTVSCNEVSLGTSDLDDLHVADPSNLINTAQDIPWTLDSIAKVTGVLDPCLALPQAPCYSIYYYHADASLNGNTQGYIASTTNCCRPINAANIDFLPPYLHILNPPPTLPGCPKEANAVLYPDYVGNGMVSFVKIPPLSIRNSSPQFSTADTILTVCKGRNFNYKILASDPDAGDSVAFHFSTPRTYTYNQGTVYFGGFGQLLYKPGFTEKDPAGNLTLDPVSGLLQGSIPDTGTYLVTISALGYRNQQPIDSITRDLYVRVFDCSLLPTPTASIPDSLSSCNGYTINFPNNSRPIYTDITWNYTSFLWNFGDGDSSQNVHPVHTYGDTGTYNTRLIIFPGLYCADTAYTKVLIYPFLHANFTYSDTCTNQSVLFNNTSSGTQFSGNIDYSHWVFKKDTTAFFSSDQFNTAYQFNKAPQTYTVFLTVGTDKGCYATDSQFVNIWQGPFPLSTHDTILSRGATLHLKVNDGNSNFNGQYRWSPPLGLSDPNSPDPILTGTMNNTYYVTVTNQYGCTMTDSILVKYYTGPDIYVPNAFTPNGDGKNDIFRPFPVGISNFKYFRVFNRYGQLVYQTSQAFAGWDGRLNGIPAPQDTYVWEVAGQDYEGKTISKKGTVILLR